MKRFPSVLLALTIAVGLPAVALAQSKPPGTEPHADGNPGVKPHKATTKSTKSDGTQVAPGTEPHADGNPGTGTRKPSTKPAKPKGTGPAPGTEPHEDGNPGVKPKM